MTQAGGPADESISQHQHSSRSVWHFPLGRHWPVFLEAAKEELVLMLQRCCRAALPGSCHHPSAAGTPCAVPGAPTGSHPPPLTPTGIGILWNLSSQSPRGWLRVTTTQELTKVTSHPSRPPSAHKDQVREGRKSYANNILNIESLPGLEGENSQSQSPTCSRRMQGTAAPPAQGHSSAPVLPPVLFSGTRSHRGAQGVCESPSVPPLGWRYRRELLHAPHHISVHSFIFTYI